MQNYRTLSRRCASPCWTTQVPPMSEQAILQLERLFGEPLVMEHPAITYSWRSGSGDQMNRTNTPGSQGGGSPPAQNTPHVRLSRTDSERIQER